MRARGAEAEAKWRGLISEQEQSGKTVAEFCRERGIAASKLYSWKRRCVGAKPALGFVQLKVAPTVEDIFSRQGFEISRATQSVWCGDVADLVEPLYALMAERVRGSHVVSTDDTIMPMQSIGKTANARMWVYLGDDAYPYNVFDFTLNRGRDGPRYFLKDYHQVLLADAYGGYNGVVAGNEITRAGCWAHLRRKVIEAGKAAPKIARQAIERVGTLYSVERQAVGLSAGREARAAPGKVGADVAPVAREAAGVERTVIAQASDGGGDRLCAQPVAGTERVLLRRRCGHRQQRERTGDESRRAESQELTVRREPTRGKDGGYSSQPDQHLSPS